MCGVDYEVQPSRWQTAIEMNRNQFNQILTYIQLKNKRKLVLKYLVVLVPWYPSINHVMKGTLKTTLKSHKSIRKKNLHTFQQLLGYLNGSRSLLKKKGRGLTG